MKLYKNKYLYTAIIILILVFFTGVRNSYYDYQYYNLGKNEASARKKCEKIVDVENVDKLSLGEKIWYDNCLLQLKYDKYSLDGYSVYTNVIGSIHLDLFMLISPLFIIVAFTFYVCKLFKSRIIKQYLLRGNYKRFLKTIFLYSYKCSFIMPVIVIIIFLICWNWAGHLVYQAFPGSTSIPHVILDDMPLNAIAYILNIILVHTIIISLALINASKNKNPILVILETIIMFLILEYFNEIILEPLLRSLGIDPGGILFLNMYTMSASWNIWVCTLELLIYNIIIGIGVYFSYRSKERLIQMCEQ